MREYKVEVHFLDGSYEIYECKDYRVLNGVLEMYRYNGNSVNVPLASIKYYNIKEY